MMTSTIAQELATRIRRRPRSGPRCAGRAQGATGPRLNSEELFERGEHSGLRSVDERVDELLLLGGAHRPASVAGELEARTGDELPGVGLARREHVCDLSI